MRKVLTILAVISGGSAAYAEAGFRDLVPGADFSVVERNCSWDKCYGVDDVKFNIERVTIPISKKVCDWSKDQWAKGGALYRNLTCSGRVANNEIGGEWQPSQGEYNNSWLSSASQLEICSRALSCKLVTDKYVIGDIVVDLGPLYQGFMDLIVANKENPYTSLRISMEKNYTVDWEFTDRQRKLFNSGEISNLYVSMQDGQAFINIARDRNNEIRLLVEYYAPLKGKSVSSSRRPKNADMSDF